MVRFCVIARGRTGAQRPGESSSIARIYPGILPLTCGTSHSCNVSEGALDCLRGTLDAATKSLRLSLGRAGRRIREPALENLPSLYLQAGVEQRPTALNNSEYLQFDAAEVFLDFPRCSFGRLFLVTSPGSRPNPRRCRCDMPPAAGHAMCTRPVGRAVECPAIRAAFRPVCAAVPCAGVRRPPLRATGGTRATRRSGTRCQAHVRAAGRRLSAAPRAPVQCPA